MKAHRVHFVFTNGCECIANVPLTGRSTALPPTPTQVLVIPATAAHSSVWIYDLDDRRVLKNTGQVHVPLDAPEIRSTSLSRTFLRNPSAKALAVCLKADRQLSAPLT